MDQVQADAQGRLTGATQVKIPGLSVLENLEAESVRGMNGRGKLGNGRPTMSANERVKHAPGHLDVNRPTDSGMGVFKNLDENAFRGGRTLSRFSGDE
jgi:hypothetical protein